MWLLENKEWLFSGVGVVLVVTAVRMIRRRSTVSVTQRMGRQSSGIQVGRDMHVHAPPAPRAEASPDVAEPLVSLLVSGTSIVGDRPFLGLTLYLENHTDAVAMNPTIELRDTEGDDVRAERELPRLLPRASQKVELTYPFRRYGPGDGRVDLIVDVRYQSPTGKPLCDRSTFGFEWTGHTRHGSATTVKYVGRRPVAE